MKLHKGDSARQDVSPVYDGRMSFPAKYPGVCVACGDRIEVGDQIESAFGRGYAHVGHQRADTAAGVSLAAQQASKPRGVNKVPDGTIGTCEVCFATAIVNSVRTRKRNKPVQVCSGCHNTLVVPLHHR